jgi:SnoaL-like polyketide cyclase
VDASWLDRYLDAWVLHAEAGRLGGEEELASLVRFFSSVVRYEDVPSAAVFEGHGGIRQMCATANQWASDLEFRVLSRQTDGSMFSFETETSGVDSSPLGGLRATGRRFVLRGVSVGRVDDDSLVSEHRDYWDLGSYLTQIGALPPTA